MLNEGTGKKKKTWGNWTKIFAQLKYMNLKLDFVLTSSFPSSRFKTHTFTDNEALGDLTMALHPRDLMWFISSDNFPKQFTNPCLLRFSNGNTSTSSWGNKIITSKELLICLLCKEKDYLHQKHHFNSVQTPER